jgi:hypothetical protein
MPSDLQALVPQQQLPLVVASASADAAAAARVFAAYRGN